MAPGNNTTHHQRGGVVQDKVVAVEAALTTSPTLVEVEASQHPSPQKRNTHSPPMPTVESKLIMQATTLQLSTSANTSKQIYQRP